MNQLPLINLCMHPGCGLKAKNKEKPGHCKKHGSRLYRHGCTHSVKRGGGKLTQGPYCILYVARRRAGDYWATKVNGETKLVHRLVMEIKLGRPLEPDEQVHHVDGNGLYNSEDNLEVIGAAAHGSVSVKRRDKDKEPF